MAKVAKSKGVALKSKQKAVAKKKPAITKQSGKATKRPDVNDNISLGSIGSITCQLQNLKSEIESYAVHMRALDRRRLNGVGIKKQGFIERAYSLALENEEFLPHWLPLDKFQTDIEIFTSLRNLFDLNRQISELIWNLVMQSSDMAYTDALEFYASVREAAKRRVDAAESVHYELIAFFKSRGHSQSDQPTEMELKRDMNALLKGRKDGKIVVENFSPKVSGGGRKLLDETFKNKGEFKETEEGKIA